MSFQTTQKGLYFLLLYVEAYDHPLMAVIYLVFQLTCFNNVCYMKKYQNCQEKVLCHFTQHVKGVIIHMSFPTMPKGVQFFLLMSDDIIWLHSLLSTSICN